jgi:hypothetical protein
MTRIFIDTDELRTTAVELRKLGDEVGEVRDRLRHAFAQTVILPPALIRFEMEHEQAQIRLLSLRGHLALDGAWVDSRARLVDLEEARPWPVSQLESHVALIRPLANNAWAHIEWGVGYLAKDVRRAAGSFIGHALAGVRALNTLEVASASVMFQGVQFVKSVTGKVISGAEDVIRGIVNTFSWILNKLWSALTLLWQQATEAVSKIGHFIQEAFKLAWDSVKFAVAVIILIGLVLAALQIVVGYLMGFALVAIGCPEAAAFVEAAGLAALHTLLVISKFPMGILQRLGLPVGTDLGDLVERLYKERAIHLGPPDASDAFLSLGLPRFGAHARNLEDYLDIIQKLPPDYLMIIRDDCFQPPKFTVLLRGIDGVDGHVATDFVNAAHTLEHNEGNYERAVRLALDAAGAQGNEDVAFIGHSQGGMVASNLAAMPSFNANWGGVAAPGQKLYHVSSVMSVGSPVESYAEAPQTDYLAVNAYNDQVPQLDALKNPWELVRTFYDADDEHWFWASGMQTTATHTSEYLSPHNITPYVTEIEKYRQEPGPGKDLNDAMVARQCGTSRTVFVEHILG